MCRATRAEPPLSRNPCSAGRRALVSPTPYHIYGKAASLPVGPLGLFGGPVNGKNQAMISDENPRKVVPLDDFRGPFFLWLPPAVQQGGGETAAWNPLS